MYPRTEYEMTEADLKELLDACRPTPVLFGSGGVNLGGDPQQNANRAWAALGKKMGFEHMTVQPISGKGTRFFTAVPSETPEARAEREKREAEEKRRMAKFRKKPVVIDAIQWQGGDYDCLLEFCGRNWARADAVSMDNFEEKENVVLWNTAERQWLHCPVGHWIIRGVKGELYPCKPDIFAQTYERTDDIQQRQGE